MAQAGSKKVIYAALAGNLAIAMTKFAAAGWTGSSAMLSEAIHSTVDTCNQGLMLLGLRRAARPPSRSHPFGYGMEIYFWAFVVALLIFALGGAISIYQGLHKIADPEPIHDAWVNFAVLGASILFEGLSFRVAVRELRALHPEVPVWSAVRGSKDPSIFAVAVEDAAALTGLVVALLGLAGAYALDRPVLDGVASVIIGGVLVLAAALLARETLSLMTGESASREVLVQARAIIGADPRVNTVEEVLTMHLGPNDILLAISVDFRDELNGAEVETAARDLTFALERSNPAITRVFLRPVRRPDSSVPVGHAQAG
jgi:cation diffusion facilitator family transporter